MLKTKLLICLLINWLCSFSQEHIQNYSSTETFTAIRAGNKVTLKIGSDIIAEKKMKEKKDAEIFLFSETRKKLLALHPTDQSKAIDWAQKFSKKGVEVLYNEPANGELLDILKISERYSVNRIWTMDKGNLYSFRDSDPDGNGPTDILYKRSGIYRFNVTALGASADKSIILVNLPTIIDFIKKNTAVSMPSIKIAQAGTVFQIVFEYTDGLIEYLTISMEQAKDLMGDKVSEKNGQVYYQLKNGVLQNTDAETTVPETETGEDQLAGKTDISISGRNYILQLWSNMGNYYLRVCGPAIDTIINGGKKETWVMKEDSCLKSADKISKLDENEPNFIHMADNLFKKMNKTIYTAKDEDYKSKVHVAYVYFKGEVSKKAAVDKEKKFVSDVIKESHLEEIANEEPTSTIVGTISLKENTVNIYSNDGSLFKNVKIDSVTFSIESGKLTRRFIYVETEEGRFSNKKAPVTVLRINERGNDKLYNLKKGVNTYIKLGDVLDYKALGGYVPDDIENLVLTPKKKSKDLSALSNLNSMVNFSVYTDLAGLLGRRGNGILNTDVTGRFITNTGNIRNVDITPLSFIEGNVLLSKFDSKFKSIDSSSIKSGINGQKDTVDRMQLIQTAWLKGSMKFNLFSARFYTNQYLHLNIAARINVVNADSLFKKDKDIIFFDYYPEIVYSINRLKNFGMDISLRWLQQRVADKEPFSNKGWESVFNPQIAFFYYPKSNQNKRIYLRFNYFANEDKDANNFYQLQFGWKTGLKLSK